jgi:ubiquinone/menaquinone biosynthesis C-methylase UbiE
LPQRVESSFTTDARALPRLPVRLAVSASGSSAPLGRTRDISLQGVYLETAQPFEVGTVVPLRVDLDGDGHPVELRAEVVRRDADGMGLRFVSDGGDGKALRQLRRWVVDRTSVRGTQKQVEQLHTSSTIEPIRAPARIRWMMEDIRQSRSTVVLVPPVRVSRDQAVLVAVEADTLVFEATDRSTLEVGEDVYAVVTREFVSWSFGLRVLAVDDRTVRCSMPESLVYSERRTRDRVRVPAGTVIRWPSPWQAGGTVSLPVVERSPEGLSFRVARDACLLTPGTPLEEAELVVGGLAQRLQHAVVRHITPEGPGPDDALRVGVSFGVPYQHVPRTPVEAGPAKARAGMLAQLRAALGRAAQVVTYGWYKGTARLAPDAVTGTAQRLRIPGRPHELAALLDTTERGEGRLRAPLVVVVPGFAGRKEQMSFLAGTIVEGFRRHGQDVAVLRFDGSNNLGESGRDEGCDADGMHALHYTMSGLVDDVDAVLAWARDNPHVEPTHLILVSVSMASIAVRHVLTRAEAADVGLWISYMGAPDAIDAVRHVSGNIDLHAYWTRGQSVGVVSLGGVLTDGDHFWADLHRAGIGDLEAARREMGRIRADVLWIHGRADAWMDPRRVKQLMDVPAPGHRELVVVDSGHLTRTGDVAVQQFVRIAQAVWRHVHRDHLPVFTPPLARMLVVSEAEWAAVRREPLRDRHAWWKDYLLDPDGLGFDVLQLDPAYAGLMDLQADRLEPTGAAVLELGAGTGNLTTRLLQRGAASVTAVDLVPEALAQLRRKSGDDPRLATLAHDLEGTPRSAVRRWLAGDLPSMRALAERVPGVHRASLDRLLETPDERIHALLRGREVDLVAVASELRLPPTAVRLLSDLNTLGRLERGRLDVAAAADGLAVLPRSLLDGPPGLPFDDQAFDAVGMSLVLSYLDHPDDVLSECFRVLRPGGRLVVSSLVTDSESSKLYLDLVDRLSTLPESDIPEGRTREQLLDSARQFVDHAAELFRLEEEGLFRFYGPDRLADLVLRRGFVDVHVDRAFGDPPQAVIVTCRKP